MSDEWGPWIEHDGRGMPVSRGTIIEAAFKYNPRNTIGPAGARGGASWDWGNEAWADPIIRYRVKRPGAMKVIDQILADVSTPERQPA